MFCSNCGAHVDDGMHFCPECGKPVQPPLSTPAASAQASQPASAPAQPEGQATQPVEQPAQAPQPAAQVAPQPAAQPQPAQAPQAAPAQPAPEAIPTAADIVAGRAPVEPAPSAAEDATTIMDAPQAPVQESPADATVPYARPAGADGAQDGNPYATTAAPGAAGANPYAAQGNPYASAGTPGPTGANPYVAPGQTQRYPAAPAQPSPQAAAPAPKRKGLSPVVIIVIVAAVVATLVGVTFALGLWGGTEVPDVVGRSQTRAEKILEDAGFDVRVRTDESDDVDPGHVISQDPEGGTRTREKRVTIVVAEDSGSSADDILGDLGLTTTGDDATSSSSSSSSSSATPTASGTHVIDSLLHQLPVLLDENGTQIDATLTHAGFEQVWGSAEDKSITYAVKTPGSDNYEYVSFGNGYPNNDMAAQGLHEDGDDNETVTPSDGDSYTSIFCHWTDTGRTADEDGMRELMSQLGLSGEYYSATAADGSYLVWIGTMGERTWTLSIDGNDGWVVFGMAPTSVFEDRWGSDFGTFSDQSVLDGVVNYAVGYSDSDQS